MLMTVMVTALRSAPTDITDIPPIRALPMATMVRHGLAAESLSERARGIDMLIMAVATTDIVAMDTAIGAATVMDVDMVMVVDMPMAVAATAAASMAAAVSMVEAAVMAVADTGSFLD